MGDETTAAALEVDFLAYGVDLLDLYRGRLSFRRVCALVEHLPDDAAVWRTAGPQAGWPRTDYLLVALERRVTLLWATVAAAFGHNPTEQQLASPLDALTGHSDRPAVSGGDPPGPETKSLREMARMMHNGQEF
ncbi:hypothetical protein JOF56_000879 [Kibdelosporangium banguiense]|uniref:Uncharacterized protein n=1 Tax=Kibdelosporangium banguiense TaxID=1365924 RepID=A0ABS4T7U1_9PSEU|nr:hypothetical protein [Kibdelosporangium banguiense]MBP2320494.1 hypothetical protein [Kibdelosporangium banguiense]